MIHLGDITAISGYTAPPVDAVIGGSPCQDLSIAGKRAGLTGVRSGLFMEQIRLIKELRNADIQRGRTGQFIRPRFMLWENVPGAFSSKKGEDFRAVLEETIRIAEPDAPDVPLPKKGRWPLADAWIGDGWSVAYRVFDAQFWGVPQRRRRIALVADFGGWAAPEILFVREGVCWDSAESGAPGEETAAGTGGGAYPAIARSLTARHDGSPCIDRGPNIVVQRVPPVEALPFDTTQITSPFNYSHPHYGDPCHPLAAGAHPPAIVMATGQGRAEILHEKAPTLNCNHEQPIVTGVDCRNGTESPDVVATLQAHNNGGFSINCTHPVRIGGQVRRLTPLECERLQGYPDGWTDIGPWTDSAGKLHKESSDRARYKALGNSIALPPWAWILKRLCSCYERPATMASLFDGIGGFPLIWERLNGPGSCIWASEIEEFPIAVTKYHFGEEIAIP